MKKGKAITWLGLTSKSSHAGMGWHHCRTLAASHIDITSEAHGKGALDTIGFKI
jgi:hypothetical protein